MVDHYWTGGLNDAWTRREVGAGRWEKLGNGEKRKNSTPRSGFGKRQMGNARGYSIYVSSCVRMCSVLDYN